jgi:hypothetical protein
MVRPEYLRQLQAFLERLRAGCHEFQVDYRHVLTDQDYEKVLGDFLVERSRSATLTAA